MKAATIKDRKPLLDAMDVQLVSLTKRAFSDATYAVSYVRLSAPSASSRRALARYALILLDTGYFISATVGRCEENGR